jgi:hypothetical protein
LKAFNASPLRDPPAHLNAFDDLGFFRVACTCGNESFTILGHPQDDGFFASPFSLRCESCQSISDLFDIAVHGFDAEVGNGCYSTRGTGEPTAYSCPSCPSTSMRPFVGFSYQIDPEELDPEDQSRTEDLFDWFYLEATCGGCGAASSVSDYECA